MSPQGGFILLDTITEQAHGIAVELCDKAKLGPGHIVVVGCSTSEINGYNVGTNSSAETGAAVFSALNTVLSEYGLYLAAQCCEHLNRAIIVERSAAAGYTMVNVVPLPIAGGSFAAAAYIGFNDPVALESIQADAGLDIGGTLIGMHLKKVAVPLRLDTAMIGKAAVLAARTRPPLIGGSRATYDEKLL